MVQINIEPETGEETIGEDHEWTTVASNTRYNLRPRPTRRNNRYTMLQDGQKPAMMTIPKPHTHVIMTQMNIREGIKKFSENGNEAMLKELNQLHQQEALLPSRERTCHMRRKRRHHDT